MKKILVLPLLLCLIFCSFLSLDKNLDEFDPDRTAYGSYDHRVVWGSYASSDKAALPQQEVLDSRAVLYSESDMSALMDCPVYRRNTFFSCSHMPHPYLFAWFFRQAYIQFKLAGCVTPVNTYYFIRICRYRGHAHMPHKHEPALYYPFYPRQGWA